MQLRKNIEGEGAELLYKPHMDFLWSSLVSGTSGLKCQHLDSELRFKKSNKGQQGAEVHNWLLCSSRLRRIRLTYFDAGSAGQAFNSVLYPDFRYDFPLLGIDLLSFGRRKILCVVDFQPLSQDSKYLERYTAGLAPIRQQFAEHCSHMTTRIYNENSFFSKQLIFFRSDRGAADSSLQFCMLLKVKVSINTSVMVEYLCMGRTLTWQSCELRENFPTASGVQLPETSLINKRMGHCLGLDHNDKKMPNGLFFTVYKDYVKSYLNGLFLLDPQDDPAFMASVQRGQAAYDKYSGERDPAIRLFSTYFGQQWSEQLTEYFLFPLARHFDRLGTFF